MPCAAPPPVWRGALSSFCLLWSASVRLQHLLRGRRDLAQTLQRWQGQAVVETLEGLIDFRIGLRKETPTLRVTFHQEGAKVLHFEHPDGLGQTEFVLPEDVFDAPNTTAIDGADAVPDRRQIDGSMTAKSALIHFFLHATLANDSADAVTLQQQRYMLSKSKARRSSHGRDIVHPWRRLLTAGEQWKVTLQLWRMSNGGSSPRSK